MRTRLLSLLLLFAPSVLAAQPSARALNPYLFVLDLQGTALDEFPSSIKALTGVMTVVDKNGQHMLKASSPSEFLITLPQALPADFTIELDVIPKACCAPDDIMLEGTPTMNRGPASAQLTWHPERLSAVGGSPDMYQAAMPEDLAAATPGNLTHVVVEFHGTQIKLYTNGRRLYTLDKQFARGRVLRVWLGGADDGLNAAYLASFRIGAGPASPSMIAGGPSTGIQPAGGTQEAAGAMGGRLPNPQDRPQAPGGSPETGNQSQPIKGGAPVPTVVTNVTVEQGSAGPIVRWLGSAGPATYTVKRWKIDDQTCCNNASGNLSGPPWQDAPPPLSGTYMYQVTILTNSGTGTGETQFVYQKLAGGGQILTPDRPLTSPVPPPAPPIQPNTPLASGSEVPVGLTVTVTLGANGPVVSWPLVPNATGYGVIRSKLDDADCCNNNSGRAALPAGPWQDQPLPLSGTYLYTVNAQTPVGLVYGQAQFGYRKPDAGATSTGSQPLPSAPSAPIAANTGVVKPGLTVSVTLGANGPVVTWPLVSRATGYSVTRVKVDDANCCNANSGRALLPSAPWQDQPLPMSGTYLYTVTAETPLGQLQGDAQFGYRKPEGGGGGAVEEPGNPQLIPVPPSKLDLPSGGGGGNPPNSGQYRITITGFRVASETQDVNADIDGRGDEVYAAAVAVVMDRHTQTIRDRVIKRTTEYGDIGNGTFFTNRIKAGTKTQCCGGIWTGNGIEQVPAGYDPSGTTFPPPSDDQFPLTVWQGALTDGVEAVLVVPTIWERDVDPSPWVIWSNDWRSASLTSLFSAPTIQNQLLDLKLDSQISPTQPTALPFSMAPADLLTSTRDHPIGIVPQPPNPLIPITAIYQDRYAVVTREKLASLAPGGSVILPILFWEPATIYTRGRYTLYLRVERLP